MPETYTQVCAFCRLAGHYRRFIKGFANIAHPLYDVLGKEVKMGPMDLSPEAQEAMDILKGRVQSTPILVFPDFDKPFLLEMDASKEGLGLAPFVVRTDNPLTYMLMTLNLDTTGHRWVGALASFQFELEFQKGANNGAVDALSRVPVSQSQETVQSLLEGVIVGVPDRGEAKASEELLEEHECLSQRQGFKWQSWNQCTSLTGKKPRR